MSLQADDWPLPLFPGRTQVLGPVVTDARVKIGVENIHREVHPDVDDGKEHHHGLDYRIVSSADGFDCQVPGARQAEHRFP